MKDTIEIKENRVIAKLSITLKKLDGAAYMGYVPSLDIPFTSPSKAKATKIAGGLVNSLLMKWQRKGDLKEKLELYNFSENTHLSQTRFEHSAPSKSFKIREEFDLV